MPDRHTTELTKYKFPKISSELIKSSYTSELEQHKSFQIECYEYESNWKNRNERENSNESNSIQEQTYRTTPYGPESTARRRWTPPCPTNFPQSQMRTKERMKVCCWSLASLLNPVENTQSTICLLFRDPLTRSTCTKTVLDDHNSRHKWQMSSVAENLNKVKW
jgi:hypothetical protein